MSDTPTAPSSPRRWASAATVDLSGRKPRVGVVSKPAHSKGMVQALKDAGAKVVPLKSNATSFPASVDAIVVRTASCSTGASRAATAYGKHAGVVVIHTNGSADAVDKLRAANILIDLPLIVAADMKADPDEVREQEKALNEKAAAAADPDPVAFRPTGNCPYCRTRDGTADLCGPCTDKGIHRCGKATRAGSACPKWTPDDGCAHHRGKPDWTPPPTPPKPCLAPKEAPVSRPTSSPKHLTTPLPYPTAGDWRQGLADRRVRAIRCIVDNPGVVASKIGVDTNTGAYLKRGVRAVLGLPVVKRRKDAKRDVAGHKELTAYEGSLVIHGELDNYKSAMIDPYGRLTAPMRGTTTQPALVPVPVPVPPKPLPVDELDTAIRLLLEAAPTSTWEGPVADLRREVCDRVGVTPNGTAVANRLRAYANGSIEDFAAVMTVPARRRAKGVAGQSAIWRVSLIDVPGAAHGDDFLHMRVGDFSDRMMCGSTASAASVPPYARWDTVTCAGCLACKPAPVEECYCGAAWDERPRHGCDEPARHGPTPAEPVQGQTWGALGRRGPVPVKPVEPTALIPTKRTVTVKCEITIPPDALIRVLRDAGIDMAANAKLGTVTWERDLDKGLTVEWTERSEEASPRRALAMALDACSDD